MEKTETKTKKGSDWIDEWLDDPESERLALRNIRARHLNLISEIRKGNIPETQDE